MRIPAAAILASTLVIALAPLPASQRPPDWPRRVLVTNDNGIDDTAIVELARALAEIAEVYVVAATTDRSGTSNLMAATLSGRYEVERRELGPGITAWALDGYPADCVLFALSGPLRDSPPDLVVSGINGGANLADAWFGSGTIGAARAAAYFGIPAIAVSGVEDDDPRAVRAAVRWTVELVRSAAVRSLEPSQYLTVSLPETTPEAIRGVELTRRARGLLTGRSTPIGLSADRASRGEGSEPQPGESWRLTLEPVADLPPGTDVAAAAAGRIAVVAMRVDEHDPALHAALAADPGALPSWSPPAAAATGACRSGLGIVFDEAEDERGEEWGVLIEEILPGGRAEQIGLVAGDVIVRLDGEPLARPGREDPDERFDRLLRRLDCEVPVELTYVRDGKQSEASFLPVADP